jgi:hypothetical protein
MWGDLVIDGKILKKNLKSVNFLPVQNLLSAVSNGGNL